MSSLELSPQLFAIFTGLVEEACGLHYGARDRDIFAAKLSAHVSDLGYDSLLDYYYHLRYDDPGGAERARLIEMLLVHETYFFRELPPLREAVDGHLTQIVRTRGRARVWSAACSTGEEPLTVAMLLDERGLLDRVEIIGTDVSAQAIAQASSGRHRKRALRDDHPAELAARYLSMEPLPPPGALPARPSIDGPQVMVAPRLRAAVTFKTLNLFDAGAIRMLGRFDLILCRNVLIYFRDELIARAIDHLAAALAPDGLLAVGVSESLLRFGTGLACEERGNSFFYRRAR
jgi:chemotaxis protein methyltransferase CheR